MESLLSDPSSTALTIGEYLASLLPRLRDSRRREAPAWPADVFALAMSLIRKTGLYTQVLNDWPPSGSVQHSIGEWAKNMSDAGAEWRRIAGDRAQPAPAGVQQRWKTIMAAYSDPLPSLKTNRTLAECVFELSAMADEASAGAGVSGISTGTSSESARFYRISRSLLVPDERGSSLCAEIDKSRVRVLPKMHSPAKGLTVRSLSHHLAVCSGDEICPFWETPITYTAGPDRESMNLLVIPWPDRIRPIQFYSVPRNQSGMRNMPNTFEFFGFQPMPAKGPDGKINPGAVVAHVEALYLEAVAMMGRVDGIIFPELSLTGAEFDALREAEFTKRVFLVSGIAEPANPSGGFGTNQLYCDVPRHKRIIQNKHHRWKLDTAQIGQYGLGSLLSPERSWWEHISLDNRKLYFASLLPWLVLSVVICEDLARPDPVGDLVRAVGPNLVIALLMDGPQLRERWSARYATTLAEDPGCSVLSLTSIGMSLLSRPTAGVSRSRVIGLWKDAHSNTPVEIELPEGSGGVVLSLTVRWMDEWTADGREDRGATGYPLLSGIHPIKNTSKQRGEVLK